MFLRHRLIRPFIRQRGSLRLALWHSVALTTTLVAGSSAAAVEIRFVECDALPEGELRVMAESTKAGEPGSGGLTHVADSERRHATLDLDVEGGPWDLRVVTPGVWSETRRVRPPISDPVELHVWRESRLIGRWSVPRAEEAPDEVVWRLWPAHSGPAQGRDRSQPPPCPVQELTVRCPVGDGGAFACPLPVGRWNARAKAEGWAAHHLWEIELTPGGGVDLGAVRLRRGATLLGQVTTVDGPAHPEATRIELRPVRVLDRDPQAKRDREALTLTEQLNRQGYFVFEDVPPGLYDVVAHQPGYSRARMGPVEVRADLETTLVQPLVLTPPTHLTVAVDPIHAPGEGPWRVRLDPAGETTAVPEASIEGETDELGRWTSPALEVGAYLVRVLDGDGNVVAVEGPLDFAGREQPFLQVSLDLVEVRGEVRLGERPLEGELWFGGRTGDERVRVASDEEGRFEAILPRSGTWRVDVSAPAAGVEVRGEPVEVEEGEKVLIELPSTELAGAVVDATGAPVPDARIQIARIQTKGLSTTSADSDGRFVVRGLSPATYWVQAVSGERSSAMHTVPLAADAPSPPVRLVVEEALALSGRLVSDHGGVGGALVFALPFLGNGSMGGVSDTVTGTDGRFTLRLPSATDQTLLVVMPLGFGLTVQRVEGTGPVEVHAAAAEGTVLLPRSPELETGEMGLLLVAGEPLDPKLLAQWVHLHRDGTSAADELRLPAMPAGQYAYCTVSFEEALLVVARRARPTRCSTGHLAPGGELALPQP